MSYNLPLNTSGQPLSSGHLHHNNTITPDTTTSNDDNNLWNHRNRMTRTLAHYDLTSKIGSGTYGEVYSAYCKDTKQVVALKKLRPHPHTQTTMGTSLQQIREIKILKRLQHPNLLRLIEVVTSKGVEHLDPEDEPLVPSSSSKADKPLVIDVREKYKGNLFLVLEYLPHDLSGLLDIGHPFTPVQIKCIVQQLLQALSYLHQHKYIHRDIKSSNILLDNHFRLKLADFGLARSIEPPIYQSVSSSSGGGKYSTNANSNNEALLLTNKVITLWYRPPEILVGAQEYGPAVDIWSAGCILAELFLGKPLFPGKTELDQFQLILNLMGTPADDTWDYMQHQLKKDPKRTASGLTVPKHLPNRLKLKYESKIPESALALLERMLEWDPRKRVSAANALQHKYFWLEPVAPQDPLQLGRIFEDDGVHFHEFQTKKKRKEAKAAAEQAKEEALLKGRTPDEAQAKFDKVYQSLMKRVAKEGFQQKEPVSKSMATVELAQPNSSNSKSKYDSGGVKNASERKNRGHSDADLSRGSNNKRNRDKSSNKQHRNRHDHRNSDKEEGEEDGNSHTNKKQKRDSDGRRNSREGDDLSRSRSGSRKKKRRIRGDRRRVHNSDRSVDHDYDRVRDGDRPREMDRPRDMDRSRDIDRPRDMDRSRDMDRPRDLDRLRDMDRSRHMDRSRDMERPRDMDRSRDMNRTRDLDRPRDIDRSRDMDRPRDFDRPGFIDRPRDKDRVRDMDRPRDMSRPHDMDRSRDMARPLDIHRERYDRERQDIGRRERERDNDPYRPRRDDDQNRFRDPPRHPDSHYGPGSSDPDRRGMVRPNDRTGNPALEDPGYYGRPMSGGIGRGPPPLPPLPQRDGSRRRGNTEPPLHGDRGRRR
jgi:serine/threonine protein kinase